MNVQGYIQKIEERNFTVGILGLGYVGLPLMWTFHEQGLPVLGFDVDEAKVKNLTSGTPYIKHLGKEMMQSLAQSDICDATTIFSIKRSGCGAPLCTHAAKSVS